MSKEKKQKATLPECYTDALTISNSNTYCDGITDCQPHRHTSGRWTFKYSNTNSNHHTYSISFIECNQHPCTIIFIHINTGSRILLNPRSDYYGSECFYITSSRC